MQTDDAFMLMTAGERRLIIFQDFNSLVLARSSLTKELGLQHDCHCTHTHVHMNVIVSVYLLLGTLPLGTL